MKPRLVEMLRSPCCRREMTLNVSSEECGEVAAGELTCQTCKESYPVSGCIPRFVPADNYASNFGLQWRRFQRTQLDSHSGVPISRDRFMAQTGWGDDLDGKLVLDLGCGAGRFVEIALSLGARVVALDYSGAVDACWENHRCHPRLDVVQGDINVLPFVSGAFDYVYCFGVLQHTPDAEAAFRCLPPMLCAGGRLAVDIYPKTGLEPLWPKYWLRPLTRRVNPVRLFRAVTRVTPPLLRISRALGRIPRVGRKLRYVVPVANYEGIYPLSSDQLMQWAVLDTFDMLAPAYDRPQTAAVLSEWFRDAGMDDLEVFRKGQLIGRATMPG